MKTLFGEVVWKKNTLKRLAGFDSLLHVYMMYTSGQMRNSKPTEISDKINKTVYNYTG